MPLSDYILKDCVLISDDKETKKSILEKISRNAKINKNLNNISSQEIYQALEKREEMISTAIAKRIAIPHCRLKNISEFAVGIVISRKGVDFNSADGDSTKIFVYIIAPVSKQTEHMRILAAISQFLKSNTNIENLLDLNSTEEVYNYFLDRIKVSDEDTTKNKYKMLNVILQKEELFDNVINILTELENTKVIVLEAENASRYLYHKPLFSSFLENKESNYCKLLTAIIPENQLKQALELLAEIAKKQSPGVLYFTQSLNHLSGNLNI